MVAISDEKICRLYHLIKDFYVKIPYPWPGSHSAISVGTDDDFQSAQD
jgi:hypothetical protein